MLRTWRHHGHVLLPGRPICLLHPLRTHGVHWHVTCKGTVASEQAWYTYLQSTSYLHHWLTADRR